MPTGVEANWVTGSHDMGRVGSRLGDQLIDHMNMLALMLPGLTVTYQGEEVGMLDTAISWEDTRDPAGCACGPARYQECSRDPERTPFQVSNPPMPPMSAMSANVSPHVSHVTIAVEQRVQRRVQQRPLHLAPRQPELPMAEPGQPGGTVFLAWIQATNHTT